MWRDKNIIGWCNNCNVPILDAKRCGICGRQSVKLDLRFKGEVRPLFPAEKEKVSKSFIIKKALELYFAQKQVDVKDIAEISTRVKELERKYYEILNRLNTLSRQMERILKMRK